MSLTVIGMGDDGLAGLSPLARSLLDGARVLVGGARHLDLVPSRAEKIVWPSPFSQARDLLAELMDHHPVILASGDPMWFGIGATLSAWFGTDGLTVIPHPGAFSLAAARLGWPLQSCRCLTVHGRDPDHLHLHLHPGQKLLVLAEDGQSPARVARLLEQAGFGPSPLTVLEHLGGSGECVRAGTAKDWVGEAADLNVIAVDLVAEKGARAFPVVAGLPDHAFDHDGQLTKQVVRAATLAALAPLPGQLLWDVGAGCGSVSIEWMRAGGRAVAMESRPDRVRRIIRNAARLGVPDLAVITGHAPDCLPFSDPDTIFVGGGVSVPGLLDACWAALKPGGRLVANTVTAQGEAALLAMQARLGGQMIRLAVSHLEPLGGFHAWNAAAPVTQWLGIKG